MSTHEVPYRNALAAALARVAALESAATECPDCALRARRRDAIVRAVYALAVSLLAVGVVAGIGFLVMFALAFSTFSFNFG